MAASGRQRLKAAPEHFLGRGDDDEGVRVFGVNQCLELGYFRDSRRNHQHFAFLL